MPGGEIVTNFVEAKGMFPTNATFTFPVLATTDGGAEWVRPSKAPVGYSRGLAVMPDGRTMVRPAVTFGSDSVYFGDAGCEKVVNGDGSIGYCHLQFPHSDFNGVEVSGDAGQTWGGVSYLVSQQEWDKCYVPRIKPLRDGRVVAVVGLRKRGTSGDMTHHMAVGTFVGAMNATVVWEQPIQILDAKYGKGVESDFVELPNGTLFFMHRAVGCPTSGPNCKPGGGGAPRPQNQIQNLVRRNSDGSFSPQPPTTTFPNYQWPCLVLTKENVLLHIQDSGSRYSLDLGSSWMDLKGTGESARVFVTKYYPNAVEAADGTIVVTSHNTGDDAFMPRWANGSVASGSAFLKDEHIWAQTFRLVPRKYDVVPTITPATGSGLDVLSRRAAALAGKRFTLAVEDGGGATIRVGGAEFALVSGFSAPGIGAAPAWHNLTAGAAGSSADPGAWAVRVDRTRAEGGVWVVHASSAHFTLTRRYALDPPPPSLPLRVLVNDTLASSAAEIIGVHVRHDAQLTAGTVDNVQVPGRFEPGMCGTDGPDGNPAIFGGADFEAHSTNFGAPHIWLNTTGGAALGLVALDDVFRVHAQQRQFASASLDPRVDMHCPVTTPPSVRLSDPFFGLPPGGAHTLEWAVYPFDSAECSDWFCFVNALRHSFGTDTIVIGEHSGSLNILENNPSWDIAEGAHAGNMWPWNGTGYVANSSCLTDCSPGDPRCLTGICDSLNWTAWSAEKLQHFARQHGTTVFPVANGWTPGSEVCRSCRMEDNGARECHTLLLRSCF